MCSSDLEIVGRPATGDFISVVALKVAAGDTAVVSDYATVFEENIPDLVIANKKAVSTLYQQGEVDEDGNYDQHYRTILGEEDPDAKALTAAPWSEDYDVENCDTTVAANGSLDIATIVAAHSIDTDAEKSDSELENLGLSWDFSLVEYVWGDPVERNEADYATLNGSVLTPNTAEWGNSVVDHTPIVRVKLMNGENVVKVAYIKVMIGPAITELAPVCIEGKNEFDFNCEDAESRDSVTLADMTASIYTASGMTADEFNALYVNFEDISEDVAKIEDEDSLAALNATNIENELILGEVFLNEDNLIVWTIPMDDVWAHAGEDVVKYAKYTSEDGLEYFVRLTAIIAPIDQTFYITGSLVPDDGESASDNKIREYWKNQTYLNKTYYNVAVPNPVGTDDPDICLFVNNINASFVTDEDGNTVVWKNGETAGEHLTDAEGNLVEETNIDGLDYFFCAENDGVIVRGCYNGETGEYEDIQLVYVEHDSLNLYAKVVGSEEDAELIATIKNDDEDVNNSIELLKDSELAKELLNTNRLEVLIGAVGYYCGDETKQVTILYNQEGEWVDHFIAKYVIPVVVNTVSEGEFIDGVDYGQEGSYIDIAKLIHPQDWRFRRFTPASDEDVDGVDYYENYWGYYGEFEVTVNTDDVNCDLNNPVAQKGDPQYGHPKPATIILEVQQDGWNDLESTNGFGFLTYKNNQTKVEDFNLFVKINVKYGWGYVDPATTEITIPVRGTGGRD